MTLSCVSGITFVPEWCRAKQKTKKNTENNLFFEINFLALGKLKDSLSC